MVLSLNVGAQRAARDALSNRDGSVVALDVQTGEVVVMYSNPTFDPNALTRHGSLAVQTTSRRSTGRHSIRVLIDRHCNGRTASSSASSTFKVVSTAAALDTGTATPDTPYPSSSSSTYLSRRSTPVTSTTSYAAAPSPRVCSVVQHDVRTDRTDLGNAFVPAIQQVTSIPIHRRSIFPTLRRTPASSRVVSNDEPGFAPRR